MPAPRTTSDDLARFEARTTALPMYVVWSSLERSPTTTTQVREDRLAPAGSGIWNTGARRAALWSNHDAGRRSRSQKCFGGPTDGQCGRGRCLLVSTMPDSRGDHEPKHSTSSLELGSTPQASRVTAYSTAPCVEISARHELFARPTTDADEQCTCTCTDPQAPRSDSGIRRYRQPAPDYDTVPRAPVSKVRTDLRERAPRHGAGGVRIRSRTAHVAPMYLDQRRPCVGSNLKFEP